MIATKFGIGQQVRHKTFGYLGVIVDVDSEYSLAQKLEIEDELRRAPWYYIVTENNRGEAVHAYVAEGDLRREFFSFHPEQPVLDDFANAVKKQLYNISLKH